MADNVRVTQLFSETAWLPAPLDAAMVSQVFGEAAWLPAPLNAAVVSQLFAEVAWLPASGGVPFWRTAMDGGLQSVTGGTQP